ncbi:MAG TPA: sulfatase [Verrucomicrobiae bacterium]|nr:sulfatase [Verrucomicrobiae bacterium]
MSKRLRRLWFAGVLGFTLLWSAITHARPNIVIILADDMGYGDAGCYGQKKYKTPNIDRMAAEGARLTDFYSVCPYCAPSRATLLTGRYPFRTGLVRNPAPDGGPEADQIGLSLKEITLGDLFHRAGFHTYCIGKWHLGHHPQYYPTRRGFDDYFGILYSDDMRPVRVMDGETVAEYPVILANLTKEYTARALGFIEKNRSHPFFLYFAHALPHKPLAASEDFYKKSGAGLYGDAMMELDRSVGEVLDKLKELNLATNTLVLFASDNGPWYGGSTGGLRGMKGDTWEGGIREPLIAWWPGRIPPGRVSHEPAIMMDLFTTSLDAAGVPLPSDRVIDGKDIMGLLAGSAKSPHDALFSMHDSRLFSIRSGKWKLHVILPRKPRVMPPDDQWVDPRAPDGVTILAPYEQARPSQYPGVRTGDYPKGKMALFDLETDPAEQHDVAAEHPDIVQRLRAMYDTVNAQVPRSLSSDPPRRRKAHPRRGR